MFGERPVVLVLGVLQAEHGGGDSRGFVAELAEVLGGVPQRPAEGALHLPSRGGDAPVDLSEAALEVRRVKLEADPERLVPTETHYRAARS